MATARGGVDAKFARFVTVWNSRMRSWFLAKYYAQAQSLAAHGATW